MLVPAGSLLQRCLGLMHALAMLESHRSIHVCLLFASLSYTR